MKILITGASGFVGAKTAHFAAEAGDEVFAIVRPGSTSTRLANLNKSIRQIDLDLRDTTKLRATVLQYKPDAILHLGWSGVSNAMRFDEIQIQDNIGSSCALAAAGAEAGTQTFIGIGSQAEYGASSEMLETSAPNPTTLYGAAKLSTMYLTRQLAHQAGMRHVWLRLFATYGPQDNSCWLIPFLIDEMLAGRRPKTTLGTQYWDWLYVDDVARAILAVARSKQASGIFNFGSGQAVQVRYVVESLRDLIAPNMELVFGEVPFRPDQIMFLRADISRLQAATDWTPQVSIDEGLRASVEWRRARSSWQ